MDKNDIIEYVMYTPHNTNKAVLSSMLNQLTEDSGGGESSDFSTATVTVNYVGDHSASSISGGYADVYTDVSFGSPAITYAYGDNKLPVSVLGTVNELKIPIYNGAKTNIDGMEFLDGGNLMLPDLNNSSVVSGSAEIADNCLLVWGDCVVNLALQYAD